MHYSLTLKPNKLRALLGGHPWILDGSLELLDKSNAPKDGSVVDVYSDKGRFFARGLYNSHSKIRVRLYTWNETESLDDAFWTKRISTAIDLRKELGYFSQATRLINSEGDALSGLIVDKYEDVLVMQATSLGILLRAEQFAQILQNLTGAKTVIATTEPAMARREGAPEELTADRVFGDPVPETMVIQSGGIKYEIQLLGGQKTGFYLDQRENRLAAAELFNGKTVLDMFCYHGGFSIAAAQAGAVSCLACDSSAKALEQVKRTRNSTRSTTSKRYRATRSRFWNSSSPKGERSAESFSTHPNSRRENALFRKPFADTITSTSWESRASLPADFL